MNFKKWYKAKYNSCDAVVYFHHDYIASLAAEIGVDWAKMHMKLTWIAKRKFVASKGDLLHNCKNSVAIYASVECYENDVLYPVITMINKGGAGSKIVISLLPTLWESYRLEKNNNSTSNYSQSIKNKLKAELLEQKKHAQKISEVEELNKRKNVEFEIAKFKENKYTAETYYTKNKLIDIAEISKTIDIKTDENTKGVHISFLLRNKKEITGVQKIYDSGKKEFTYGMKKKGSFVLLGDMKTAKKALFCEGFATGCSLYKANNALAEKAIVIICLDVYNMIDVVENICSKKFKNYYDCIICADNDAEKKENVGLEIGRELSKKHKLKLKYPKFGNVLKNCSDFNDLHVFCKIASLKHQFQT